MRKFALIPIFALILLLPATTSRASRVDRPHAQIVSHGIELTLMVPHAAYPRDALVRVSIVLRNVSHHKIWLEGGGPESPGKSFPQVEVLDDAGVIVYPPALPRYFPPRGPGPFPVPVSRGHQIVEHPYVALRGSYLVATVPVLKNGRFLGSATEVTTPRAHVGLTASDAPQGHPAAPPGGPVTAMIERPSWAHGKLVYEDAALYGGTDFVQHIDWTRGGDVVTAGCSPLQEWDVVAGWPNHSVATFLYTPPSPTPTPVSGPATLTIQGLAPPVYPYRVRVGDTIELHVMGFGPTSYVARGDPTHLALQEATSRGAEPEYFLWRWRAIAPGPAFIDVEQFPTRSISAIPIDIVASR